MLHLFPFRWLVQTFFVVTVLVTAAASWFGGTSESALRILRWAPAAPFVFTAAVYGCWRYITILQRWTFPFIGGDWVGSLHFTTTDGRTGTKKAKLQVKHGLLRLHLRLETDESVSRTLAVWPERESVFGDFRLYYVYLVERREGVGDDRVYRGTAIMRIRTAGKISLRGDYFTEHKSTGSIEFQR